MCQVTFTICREEGANEGRGRRYEEGAGCVYTSAMVLLRHSTVAMSMSTWLYRLQHRLALTRNESVALLTLTGLFLVGLGLQTYQRHNAPPLVAADSTQAAVHPDSLLVPATPPEPEVINVNTASRSRLQDLSGIGPALAGRIVEYRMQQPFEAVDELQNVRGIGPKTLESLRPRVTVSGGSTSTASVEARP